MGFAFFNDIVLGAAVFDEFGLHGSNCAGIDGERVNIVCREREDRREYATKSAFWERGGSERRRHERRRKRSEKLKLR